MKKCLFIVFLFYLFFYFLDAHPFLFMQVTKLVLTDEGRVLEEDTKFSMMGVPALILRGTADTDRNLKVTRTEYEAYLKKYQKNFMDVFQVWLKVKILKTEEKLFFSPDSLFPDLEDTTNRDRLLTIVLRRKYIFSAPLEELEFSGKILNLKHLGEMPQVYNISLSSVLPIKEKSIGYLKDPYTLENIAIVPQLADKRFRITFKVSGSSVSSSEDDKSLKVKSSPQISFFSGKNLMVSYLTDQKKFLLLGLFIAFFLGVFHAFTPGHGKTIVAFYMTGENVKLLDVFVLALTVTFTHVFSVFILGIATLILSDYFLPQKLFPILKKISASLILGVGLFLLVKRFRELRGSTGREHCPHHAHDHEHHHHGDEDSFFDEGDHHPHIHKDELHCRHSHTHSHNHSSMSREEHLQGHLKEFTQVKKASNFWERLVTLLGIGISGGIIPCPSAFVVLLVAISLGKVGEGLLLLLAFSLGLGVTLSGVAISFYYAGKKFRGYLLQKGMDSNLVGKILGVFSAGIITLLGIIMLIAAL